jgi:hypothetical protein
MSQCGKSAGGERKPGSQPTDFGKYQFKKKYVDFEEKTGPGCLFCGYLVCKPVLLPACVCARKPLICQYCVEKWQNFKDKCCCPLCKKELTLATVRQARGWGAFVDNNFWAFVQTKWKDKAARRVEMTDRKNKQVEQNKLLQNENPNFNIYTGVEELDDECSSPGSPQSQVKVRHQLSKKGEIGKEWEKEREKDDMERKRKEHEQEEAFRKLLEDNKDKNPEFKAHLELLKSEELAIQLQEEDTQASSSRDKTAREKADRKLAEKMQRAIDAEEMSRDGEAGEGAAAGSSRGRGSARGGAHAGGGGSRDTVSRNSSSSSSSSSSNTRNSSSSSSSTGSTAATTNDADLAIAKPLASPAPAKANGKQRKSVWGDDKEDKEEDKEEEEEEDVPAKRQRTRTGRGQNSDDVISVDD